MIKVRKFKVDSILIYSLYSNVSNHPKNALSGWFPSAPASSGSLSCHVPVTLSFRTLAFLKSTQLVFLIGLFVFFSSSFQKFSIFYI